MSERILGSNLCDNGSPFHTECGSNVVIIPSFFQSSLCAMILVILPCHDRNPPPQPRKQSSFRPSSRSIHLSPSCAAEIKIQFIPFLHEHYSTLKIKIKSEVPRIPFKPLVYLVVLATCISTRYTTRSTVYRVRTRHIRDWHIYRCKLEFKVLHWSSDAHC